MTFQPQSLFLGFLVEPSFCSLLSQVNPHVIALFIGANEEYLAEWKCNQTTYLGKKIGMIADDAAIQLAADHIVSILKKLVPNYSYSESSLILLPIVETIPS